MMHDDPAAERSQVSPTLTETALPSVSASLDRSLVARALVHELVSLEDLLRRDFISEKRIDLKYDSSLVTEADKSIELILTDRLPKILPGSAVLGEESAPKSRKEAQEILSSELLWIVDPIDGTTNFAFGLPLFAISVGLMQREPEGYRPVLGALLLAGSSQIISTDGTKVVHRCVRTCAESVVEPGLRGPLSHAPMLCSGVPLESSPMSSDQSRFRFLGSTALDIAYCALGSGIGTTTQACIWDFAGALPIALAAGLELRSMSNGSQKTHFAADDFHIEDGKAWGLKERFVLSRPEHRSEVEDLLGTRRIVVQ